MRLLVLIGIAVLLLGILSSVVPIPISKTRELKAADASVTVTMRHHETLSPVVSGIVCAAGSCWWSWAHVNLPEVWSLGAKPGVEERGSKIACEVRRQRPT